MPKVSAIVLAAGFSSRMGEFKPLLPLAGTSPIGRVTVALRQAGVEDVIVVTGYRASELLPELTRYRLRHTMNDSYAAGMYSSVQSGVQALAADTAAFFSGRWMYRWSGATAFACCCGIFISMVHP